MTIVWQLPVLVAALLAWLNTPPVSLADAARKEAVRRALVAPSSALYTNDNLPPPRPSDEAAPPAASGTSAPDPGDTADVAAASGPPQPEPSAVIQSSANPFPPRDDEPAWRARTAELQAALDRDRDRLSALQSRIGALERDVISRDDPAQRASLAQELAKALADQERLAATIQAGQHAMATLREEARRRGVPPGWIR